MTTPLPTWITTHSDDDSPFRADTRTHFAKRAATDPRLGELIARLQAKGEIEGSNERDWARRVCKEGRKMMANLHTTFAPADEDDVLRLAAYMSDHSYAHFFMEYLNAPKETHGEYAAIIQRIAPIIAEVQPAVAVGFAPQIHDVYAAQGKTEEVEALFATMAKQYPHVVMDNHPRLKKCFSNYQAIVATAEADIEATANDSAENTRFAERMRARQAVDKQIAPYNR